MDLHKKIQEINNRWEIPNDESYEKKFNQFKQRILNIFSDIDSHIPENDVSHFCNAMGIKEIWTPIIDERFGKNIINQLQAEADPKKFLRLIEVIFALKIRTSSSGIDWSEKYSRQILIDKTQQALKFSDIAVTMTVKDGDVIFYPAGEVMLDREVVNNVLSFLTDSPHQHFVNALKAYQENSSISRVKSADSLRRSIEEFLRIKLGNQKGLKENISALGLEIKKLKGNNDLKNLVTTILSLLDDFFNKNSKHRDGNINETENEYLIYQVALLMRYIEKILK